MPTYLITGARQGIGLEYVQQLSTLAENTVIAVVRSLDGDLTSLRSIINHPGTTGTIYLVQCELSSLESVASLPAQLPSGTTLHFIVQNAALLERSDHTALTETPERLLAHFSANVVGPSKLIQVLEPFFAADARIVLITSGMGSLGMLTNGRIPTAVPSYSISKAALNMLTVHLALALKGKAMIACVDPGHVKTQMGGPHATVEVADSASGVLGVLRGLKEGDSGHFFLYNGQTMPW